MGKLLCVSFLLLMLAKLGIFKILMYCAILLFALLDELIDFQGYPVRAAEIATRARRSLGIGYIGLAHYLAKHGEQYADEGAWKLVHDLTEAFQYNLIKATVNLAKEKGACEYSGRTKYGNGILPVDTYKKDVDELVPNELHYDWESLRSEVLKYGVRNSTLSAQMPSESSSVVSNATNGIEPPSDTCPLRRVKKDRLSRLSLNINLLRTIILFSGIWSPTLVILILLL